MVRVLLFIFSFLSYQAAISQIYSLENIDIKHYNKYSDTLQKYFWQEGFMGSFIEFNSDSTFYLKFYLINKNQKPKWEEGYGKYKALKDSTILNFERKNSIEMQSKNLPFEYLSIKKKKVLTNKIRVKIKAIRSLRGDTIPNFQTKIHLWKGTEEGLNEPTTLVGNSFEIPYYPENINWHLSVSTENVKEIYEKWYFEIKRSGDYEVVYNTSSHSNLINNGKAIILTDINKKTILRYKSQLYQLRVLP